MGLEGMQVDVTDDDQLVQRVAAIDIAKASGMVCTRVPHEATPGKRVSKVWQVAATTNAILGLAEQLASEDIERVVLESTSDYWRPFYYTVCRYGSSTPAMSRTSPEGLKPTSSTRSGWPSLTSGACCAPRSSRRSRSAGCATTPAFVWT